MQLYCKGSSIDLDCHQIVESLRHEPRPRPKMSHSDKRVELANFAKVADLKHQLALCKLQAFDGESGYQLDIEELNARIERLEEDVRGKDRKIERLRTHPSKLTHEDTMILIGFLRTHQIALEKGTAERSLFERMFTSLSSQGLQVQDILDGK